MAGVYAGRRASEVGRLQMRDYDPETEPHQHPPHQGTARWRRSTARRPACCAPGSRSADRSRDGVRVLITGPRGFNRTVAFARDEAPKRIARPAARPSIAAAQGIRRAARKAKAAAATTAPAKAARKKRRLTCISHRQNPHAGGGVGLAIGERRADPDDVESGEPEPRMPFQGAEGSVS